jgi:hypothetical protein
MRQRPLHHRIAEQGCEIAERLRREQPEQELRKLTEKKVML